MPLNITARIEDKVAILELSGSLTLAPSLATLRDNARQILSSPNVSGIILNVSQIAQADSAGLGELMAVYTIAAKRGCPVRLLEATPTLRKMLAMTHLDCLLPNTTDINKAKAEMKRESGFQSEN